MITEASAVSEEQLARLADRGVDDLIAEYRSSPEAGRKTRLEDFFRLCQPEDAPRTARDLDVTLGDLEELRAVGRVSVLRKGMETSLEVLGRPVPDADVLVFDISGSTILSDQTVLVDGLYVTNQVRHMSGGWLVSGEGYDLKFLHNVNRATRLARLRLPPGTVRLPDSSVYFLFQAVIGCVSFGHFILDTLVQLIAYDHLKAQHGAALTPIVTNEHPWIFKWPGMEWLFSGLIGPVSDIVHLQAHSAVQVSRAYTTNRLVHVGDSGVAVSAFSYMRKRIFETFAPTPGFVSPKRIYVSRKDAGSREADNIDGVEEALASRGFTTVVVQDLTPQETYDLFRGAEIVVGMHGSGLMYNTYIERPATVIELSYPGFEWDVILACAAACGHEAIRVGYDGEQVDMAALNAALDELG